MNTIAQLPSRSGNDANSIMAANVRGELGLAGLTQADLAGALGEGGMWLSRRMNGLTGFSVTDAQRIADFFGIDVASLFVDRRRNLKRASRDSNPQPSDPWFAAWGGNRQHFDDDWIAPIRSIDDAFEIRQRHDELVPA